MTGTLISIETTRGSPFGEQWWTIEIATFLHELGHAVQRDTSSKKPAKKG